MYTIKPYRWISLITLVILISGAYANTFNSPWQMDDSPNIVNNTYLHLKRLDIRSIVNTFFTDVRDPSKIGDRLYRPIPCFTFALNWYLHRDHVLGYHVVNTGIHILTAFILYLSIILLYQTPKLNKPESKSEWIAIIATLIWALNPLQTQAVTYIVQRMAQLAALFYLSGIYYYLKGRLTASPLKKYGFWLFASLSYLCAMGSKENAAMLPLAIILIESIFFKTVHPFSKKNMGALVLGSLIFILFIGAVFYSGKDSLFFMKGYQDRPFTFMERLLSQPRIILFYLSQLFFPAPYRLSIAHDFPVSTSLLSPYSTLPSILIIFAICMFAFYKKNKFPILSFGILFYFLNHIIESSIIPLELVFEHRNYLPSLFLFWPLVEGLSKLTENHRLITISKSIIGLTMVLLIIGLASASHIRNRAWKEVHTLWTDAMTKAPNQARPLNVLATELAWGKNSYHPNRYEMALSLYQKALEKEKSTKTLEAAVLSNMAAIYFNTGNNDNALNLFEKSLQIDPDSLIINYQYALALLKSGQWKDVLHQANYLISMRPDNVMYHILKTQALMWSSEFEEALKVLEQAHSIAPDHYNVLLYLGIVLNRLNHIDRAKKILEKAFKIKEKGSMVYLALIENSIRAENEKELKKYMRQLFDSFEKKEIENRLKALPSQYLSVPLSEHLISPVILEYLENNGE